jgi:hypothetical protein
MVVGCGSADGAGAGTVDCSACESVVEACDAAAAGVVAAGVAVAASGCVEGCDSAACCAAALIEASSAAVNIHFQVRMTLLSKVEAMFL